MLCSRYYLTFINSSNKNKVANTENMDILLSIIKQRTRIIIMITMIVRAEFRNAWLLLWGSQMRWLVPGVIIFMSQSHSCFVLVGYTMADIRYKWNDGLNSVQVSGDVSLPQFKVLGHRQKTIEASLSTGFVCFFQIVFAKTTSKLLSDECSSILLQYLSWWVGGWWIASEPEYIVTVYTSLQWWITTSKFYENLLWKLSQIENYTSST